MNNLMFNPIRKVLLGYTPLLILLYEGVAALGCQLFT